MMTEGQNSYLTVTGVHSTMHLMHPSLLSDNYFVCVCVCVCVDATLQ